MPKPVSMLMVAALTLVTLVLSSRTASATENAYLAIKGQKSGVIRGDALEAAYKDQFELRNFSVTPAIPGTGSFTMSGTVSYYGLAQFFNAMVTNELITETQVTVDKPGITASSPRVKEFSVRMLNAYFTEIDVDFAQGTMPVFSFKLTTVPSGKIAYTDANGNNLTTAIPAIAGPALVTRAATPTFSAKLKTASGEIDSALQSISFRLMASWPGVGKSTLTNLSFTRAPDASSSALKAAAARGDSLVGSSLACMYGAKPGQPPTRVLGLELGSAKFATPPPVRTGSGLPAPTMVVKIDATGAEKYDVAFVPASAGNHEISISVFTNSTLAAY